MTKSDIRWRYRTRDGYERTTSLALYREVLGDPISDDYLPDEIDADDLFAEWVKRYGKDGDDAQIYWFVEGDGTFEAAPFTVDDEFGDFLTYYTWPVDAVTGDRLEWTRLPVVDKLWHPAKGRRRECANKGGFIQEFTGWKPSPFQRTVHWPTLLRATGRQRVTR